MALETQVLDSVKPTLARASSPGLGIIYAL
jgi:hypothetical protein